MTGGTAGIPTRSEEVQGSEPAHARFAVALTCIDGRVQEPLAAWVRER